MNSTLNHIKELSQIHADKVDCFNYPGRLIYLSPAIYWLTHQIKEHYGVSIPYIFWFTRDNQSILEAPASIGLGEKMMKHIEEEGSRFLQEDRERIKAARQDVEIWIEKNTIDSDKEFGYYVDLLHQIYHVLIRNQKYLITAVAVDDLLNQKIANVCGDVSIDHNILLQLCLPDEKADVIIHEDKLKALSQWCTRENVDINGLTLDELRSNGAFINQLTQCFDAGYFLQSGYGGVTLLTLEDEFNALKEIFNEKNRLIPEKHKPTISFTPEQQLWINAIKHFSKVRDYRKTMQQKVYYYQAQLLEEIARRSEFTREELEYLNVDQITINALHEQNSLRELIARQREGHLVAWTPETALLMSTGKEAQEIFSTYSVQKRQDTRELRGITASPGSATGTVRIVRNPQVVEVFNKGDILVTGMTTPDFVPLMKKAGAIITELGGMTCHAAIISRELGKPCVINTRIATNVLNDGDCVEVDAEQGRVTILAKAE